MPNLVFALVVLELDKLKLGIKDRRDGIVGYGRVKDELLLVR